MNKVPELIHDNCPSCNPKDYTKTKAKFMGEVEDCGEHKDYLYQCDDCGAKLWVDGQWAMTHKAE